MRFEDETGEVGFVGKMKSLRDRIEHSETVGKIRYHCNRMELPDRVKKIDLPKYVKENIISEENKGIVIKSAFLQLVLVSVFVMTLWSTTFTLGITSSQANMAVMYQESGDEHHVDLRSEIIGYANEDYALYPRGSIDACSPSKSIQTVQQCFEAGKSLGLKKAVTVNDVLVGEWVHTPRGCFSNLGDLHLSTYTGNELNRDTVYWHNYAAICSVKDVEPSNDSLSNLSNLPNLPNSPAEPVNTEYKIKEYGSLDDCDQSVLLTTPESCFEAARSLRVGKAVSVNDIIVGSWTHTPRGCFLNLKGGKVLFSEFPDGEPLNKGTQFWKDYAAICRNEEFDSNTLVSVSR